MSTPALAPQTSPVASDWGSCAVWDLGQILQADRPDVEDAFLLELAQTLAHPQARGLNLNLQIESWDRDDGENLLMSAAYAGMARALKALIDAGADPNHAIGLITPLGQAAFGGQADCVTQLIERGALPDGSPTSHPPLHQAAWAGSPKCCLILLDAGADPSRLDDQGLGPSASARHLAQHRNKEGVIEAAQAIDAWVEALELRSLSLAAPAPSAPPKAL
jgi:hypothetical protein